MKIDRHFCDLMDSKWSVHALAWVLCWASFLNGASCVYGAAETNPKKVSAHITRAFNDSSGESKKIETIDKDKRLILFGSDPETLRFCGQMRGTVPAYVRYYWTFEGGIPSRVPSQGVSVHIDSGPVKFSAGGNAHFHIVDKDHPEIDLAEDSIVMCHLAWEPQPGRYSDGTVMLDKKGEPNIGYIPESGEPSVDWNLRTEPPLKDCYLGRLASSTPKIRTVWPSYVITDSDGCFHFTQSGKLDGKDWGDISLSDDPITQNPAQIRRFNEKNQAVLKEHEPLEVTITADPVTLYAVDYKPDAIEAIPAFRLHLPPEHVRRLQFLKDPDQDHGIMGGILFDPKCKRVQGVHYHLPESLATALASLPKSGPGSYVWNHERNQWRAEDGDFYVQIPKVQRVVYQPAVPSQWGGTEVMAVTFLPRNGLLLALIHKSGVENAQLMELDAASGKVVWEIPIPKVAGIRFSRLAWINDDLVLGTLYARHYSGYCIMSLSQKKMIASGWSKDGGEYFISNGAVVERDHDTHKLRTLLTFSRPLRSNAHP